MKRHLNRLSALGSVCHLEPCAGYKAQAPSLASSLRQGIYSRLRSRRILNDTHILGYPLSALASASARSPASRHLSFSCCLCFSVTTPKLASWAGDLTKATDRSPTLSTGNDSRHVHADIPANSSGPSMLASTVPKTSPSRTSPTFSMPLPTSAPTAVRCKSPQP